MGKVKFIKNTEANIKGSNPDSNAIYFSTDTNKIFRSNDNETLTEQGGVSVGRGATLPTYNPVTAGQIYVSGLGLGANPLGNVYISAYSEELRRYVWCELVKACATHFVEEMTTSTTSDVAPASETGDSNSLDTVLEEYLNE